MEGAFGPSGPEALHTKLDELRAAAQGGDAQLAQVVSVLDALCLALDMQPPIPPAAYLAGLLALVERSGAGSAQEVRHRTQSRHPVPCRACL